MVISC